MSGETGASAREQILALVRQGADVHEPSPHPGAPPAPPVRPPSLVEALAARLGTAGGDVIPLASADAAREWLRHFSADFTGAAVSRLVPDLLRPPLPDAAPESASLGVSVACAAAADTGSLVLESGEGRRLQLLVPVHLVWVRHSALCATLGEALAASRERGGAALALHSGASKSADIGGVLVRGVHGPGRVVAAVVPDSVLPPS